MLPLSSILGKINPLDKNNSSNEEFCLALLINEKKVQSAIWSLSDSGKQPIYGSTKDWGNDSAEELIVAADASIASAINKMPYAVGQQPTKVILGLPEYWVSGNTVNSQRGQILQKVCHKLLLKSLGFVVTPDAVSLVLKKEEGGMPSLILLNLGETEIIVSLINQGKFLGSKIVGRSENLSFDLEEGLLRFNHQDVMPNRIYLVKDGNLLGEAEELKQNLMGHPWVSSDKKLNFLQLPKIEWAPENFEIKAVVIAGGQELGLEIRKEMPVMENIKETASVEEKPEIVNEKPVVAPVEEHQPAELEDEPIFEEVEGNFGFIQDEDILLHQNLLKMPADEIPSFANQSSIKTEIIPEQISPESLETFATEKKNKFQFFKEIPEKVFALFSKIKPFPGIRLEKPRLQFSFNKALAFSVSGIFFILGGVFFSFYKFAKAEVKVYVQPQKVENEFDFSVSPKITSVDSENMVLPGVEAEVEVSGTKTTTVNGKRLIGDKAKGEVTIYNAGTVAVTFAKGAVVKGSGNLKFTFDAETKIESASVDWSANPPQSKLGEGKVFLTAAEIGAQYNVASNSEFVPDKGSSSSLKIKNSNAFSGGSSREIQAVSKEDMEGLKKDLLSELTLKAEEEIKKKISPGDRLISGTFKFVSSSETFNHEVDDEADSLSLEQKASFTASYVRGNDLNILADKSLLPLVPDGYQKIVQKQESSFSESGKVKGAYIAKISGEFMPEVNLSEIPNLLKAKTISRAETALNSYGKFTSADILVKPNIFSIFKFMPLTEQNITVTIESL